jgi:hypothetical protein
MDSVANIDTLHTIAQVAITLIGFSGIVIVFGGRTATGWTPEESLRFYALIVGPLTALACSFVPILLGQLTNDFAIIWRISNAILGLAHLANMVQFFRNPAKAEITVGQRLNAVIGLSLITAHFLTALDFLPWYTFIFIAGLIQQIWIGLHNFLLLFKPARQKT